MQQLYLSLVTLRLPFSILWIIFGLTVAKKFDSMSESNSIITNPNPKQTFKNTDTHIKPSETSEIGRNSFKDNVAAENSSSIRVYHPLLASSVDRKADPCNNFYNFVCNGFVRDNPIPNDKQRVTQMKLLEEKITTQLKEILEKPPSNFSNELNLMYSFYNKCSQSINSTERRGVQQLFNRLRRIRKHAFFLTDWLIIMNPVTAIYDVLILPDEYNSTLNIINIVPSAPMQPFSTYFDPAYSAEYVATRNIMYEFLNLLSEDDSEGEFFLSSESDKWRRVDSLLKVDQSMAKIQEDSEFSSSSLTVGMREIHNVIDSINWKNYFLYTVPPELLANISRKAVNIKQANIVSQYEKLFRGLDRETMQDYLDWKVILYYAPFLGGRYAALLDVYNKQVYGTEPKNQTSVCVDRTSSYFTDMIGYLWIEKHFNQSTVTKVERIVNELRDSFLTLLDSNDWMDDVTKSKARQKAHAILPFVGYDRKQYNLESIKEKFKTLQLHPSLSFFESSHRLNLWSVAEQYRKLQKLNKRDSFETSATDTNAFYDPSQNQIAILAGILQDPYFNSSWPAFMNTAAIGMVAGHEITHGFDDYGAFFDEFGNRVNWWDDTTFEKFETKKSCIEKQYDNITIIDDVKLNGLRTQGENIADNGGMRSAIKTAFKDRYIHDFVVDDLEDYSSEQIFFMTYAYTWCGNIRPETIRNDVAVEEHSPAFVRVNVVLANQPEFSEAFQCPIGSPMNPREKCTVW